MVSIIYLKNNLKFIACVVVAVFLFTRLLSYVEKSGKVYLLVPPDAGAGLIAPKTTNTILLWNNIFRNDLNTFGTNGSAFIGEKRCPVDNCVVTHDRDLMPIDKYDVIIYHFCGLSDITRPKMRSEKQYYAFLSLESPRRFAITKVPKDFFNWTVTYRLDSDFPWPYFKVLDQLGGNETVVAPSVIPEWVSPRGDSNEIGEEIYRSLNKKSKKVAWFVSACYTKNHREWYVKELQKYIEVDVYGNCGPLKCPKATEDDCFDILKNDYYFYLAFENSNCRDYVTEKVLNALQHDTVPIVFGGADYFRFLPPRSYINAKDYKPIELAQTIEYLIANKNLYLNLFWWKKYYKVYTLGKEGQFPYPYFHPFCDICKTLNDPKIQPKQYKNIKIWWNGNSSKNNC